MPHNSELLSSPLYSGASLTVCQALVNYFTWFSEHPGVSKQALSDALHLQHHKMLPPGNLLPDSYTAAMTIINPCLVAPIVYDVCSNDCIIFRKAYADLTECPMCKTPRHVPGTSTPARTFTYLPLGPRLVRLFGTSNVAKLVQSHNIRDQNREMLDIHDSSHWRKAYSSNGLFVGDQRGISLAMCTDGVNPFSHQKVSYSMWPIMLTMLNLPRHIRNHFGNFLLVGIIPGNGNKEPENLNPYLDILVDELLELSGSVLYDAYQQAPFQVKAEVLLYILDYPGICKVFSVVGSGGYSGCAWCHIDG